MTPLELYEQMATCERQRREEGWAVARVEAIRLHPATYDDVRKNAGFDERGMFDPTMRQFCGREIIEDTRVQGVEFLNADELAEHQDAERKRLQERENAVRSYVELRQRGVRG